MPALPLPPWYNDFDPTEFVAWAFRFIEQMNDGSEWHLPGNNHVYKIDKKNQTLTLIRGHPRNDYLDFYWKNHKTFAVIGWKVQTMEEAGLHGAGKTSTVPEMIRHLKDQD